jgi:trk system potassium uptake protein TrkH
VRALRPILLVVGIFLIVLGAAMLLPAAVDLAAANSDWQVFAAASVLTLFVGVGLWITNRGMDEPLTRKQAFVLATLSWLAMTAFAALPFAFSELRLSPADAFFEAMSGLTTTGSTVISGLDALPPGLLLWRALLQWFGGIGIIVVAVAVLPMLQIGGMQLFKLESSDTSEKVLPRAASIALSIAYIYFLVSLACAAAYRLAGMNAFDAIAHAMTTIATGGFSTKDASIGHFGNPRIEYVSILFMIVGALPFVLYLQVLRGKTTALLADPQVRAFLGIVFGLTALITAYILGIGEGSGEGAFRKAAFSVLTVVTGTGYATVDYGQWGSFALAAFFFMMFIGGCAGSTACGIKIFRFQVVFASIFAQFRRTLHPHGVFSARFAGRPIPPDVISSVMAFMLFFLLTVMVLAVALASMGLDHLTALSAATTAVANVGPGLGPVVGPAGNFSSLPDLAKWLLSAGMLLGRLELFTVLVLFSPAFWRG